MLIRSLSGKQMLSLASETECIAWARNAMIAVHRGEAEMPLRWAMHLPNANGALGFMPGYLGGSLGAAGVKIVSLVPPEARAGPSHAGLFVLFDGDGLSPRAIMCGATLTAMRTSAMTAAAALALARPDSRILGILGAGDQARFHVNSMAAAFPLERIVIWARVQEKAKALAAELTESLGLSCMAAEDVESVAEGADILCTVTASETPVLHGAAVKPGAHVNLVGSSHKGAQETDHELLLRSEVFVDYLPSVRAQAGEILSAIEAGHYEEGLIRGEIGAVFDGAISGRSGPDAITVYKSLGVSAQDIFTASKILDKAEDDNVGVQFEL